MKIVQMKDHGFDSIIESQYNENHVLIRLKDKISQNEILERLHSFFDKLFEKGKNQIVFDMGQIPFPNGSFIAMLISKTIEARRRGGDVQIINLLDSARNNLSIFTPLTFLSITSKADHLHETPEVRTRDRSGFKEVIEGKRPHRIRINSTIEALQDVTDFVNLWAIDADIEPILRSKLKIAVHEACMNVIEHGYQFASDKELEIEIKHDKEKFMVMIFDWGTSFEKFGRSDYNVQDAFENQQRGGYGFYIMQQSVDEIRYEFGEDGNCLTLILELKKKGD